MSGPVRVVIVHSNRLLREGLAAAFARDERVEVLAGVGTTKELEPDLSAFDPDVFVVDLGLPGRTGLAQAREVSDACPRSAILMTGLRDVEDDVLAACEAGATGFLQADASLRDLLEHVRAVAQGETRCTPRIAALLSARLRQRVRDLQRLHTLAGARLTRRELEIIGLIERRLSNKEIAAELAIEVQTVKNHIHHILEKLDLPGRHAAVRYARENGLLTLVAQRDGAKPGER